MTPEQYQRVNELFLAASERTPAERGAYLDAECDGDTELRAEVERMLAADGATQTDFLEPPADIQRPTPARISIEGYEIVRELHRGGQGIVYQAIQRSTKRKVAVKVLLEGPFASKSARRRFEREIELVAQLKHPNIIAVFHSGETPDGHAFCIMDYIRGKTLKGYARDKKPTLEETLALFRTVCDAVNYAHQKGVIHRDLKPSNIIVDSDGVPKVLDFGLARLITSPLDTLVSMTGQVMGTLPYLSPEQARGNPDEIDTRTDVYALGVMLYELLTGHYPYPVVGQMADVLKHIAETEPTPPSRVWKSDSGVTQRSSRRLRTGQCPIDAEFQTVIYKALAKERHRRYQSALDLSDDIGRYLADEPIEAKRDSFAYVLRKQLWRYRVPVGFAATIIILLIAGLATSLAFWRQSEARRVALMAAQDGLKAAATKAEQSAAEARRREEETRQVAEFQTAIFSDLDLAAMGLGIKDGFREQVRSALERQYVGEWPSRRKRTAAEIDTDLELFDRLTDAAQAPDVARGVLDAYILRPAVRGLEGRLRNMPLIQARIRGVLGSMYHALGLFEPAEDLLRQSLATQKSVLGDQHPEVAACTSDLASLLSDRGDYEAAALLYREALATRRNVLGKQHADVATNLNQLAVVHLATSEFADAEKLLSEALEMRRTLLGQTHPDVITTMIGLGHVLERQHKYADAELLLTKALTFARQQPNGESIHINALMALGTLLVANGDYVKAEPLYREAVARVRGLRGDEHWETVGCAHALALLLRYKNEYAEAEALLRQGLSMTQRLLGDTHPKVIVSLLELAALLQARGDLEAAEGFYVRALALSRQLHGDDHPSVARALHDLALVLKRKGEYERAEPLYREALSISRNLGDERAVATNLTNLAMLVQEKEEYDTAESLLREALDLRRKLFGNAHPEIASSLNGLGELMRQKQDLAAAEAFHRDALVMRKALLGEHRDVATSLNNLGLVLQAKGDSDAAESVYRESLALYRKLLGEEHPLVATSLSNIGVLLRDKGDDVAAERALREALLLRERILPPDHLSTVSSRNQLAFTLLVLASGNAVSLDEQRRYLTDAEAQLVLAHKSLATRDIPPTGLVYRVFENLIRLFELRNAVDPNRGHDRSAMEWRLKYDAWQATTQPTSAESDGRAGE